MEVVKSTIIHIHFKASEEVKAKLESRRWERRGYLFIDVTDDASDGDGVFELQRITSRPNN